MMFKIIRKYSFFKKISAALQIFFKETKSPFVILSRAYYYPEDLKIEDTMLNI